MPKVLVIGFDGATWDIIKPLTEQGSLPTFKNLIKESTWGYMESTIPPISIPAWISMFSGLTPEQLGMFDFINLTIKDNAAEMRLFSSKDSKGKLLWNFLSKEGIKSLVLNIPGIYPPYSIEGHLIGLDLTPLEKCTYPEELEKILIEEYDLNKMKEDQKMLYKGEKPALKLIDYEEKKIAEILCSFSQTFSYDVIFVRFGIPDHVSHHSKKDEEMKKCHIVMDNILKHVIDSVEFDYLILVSDHGIKKVDKVFYINKFLEEIGLHKPPLINRILIFFGSVVTQLGGERLYLRIYNKVTGRDMKRRNPQMKNLDIGESTVFAYSTTNTTLCPLYITNPAFKDDVIKKIKACKYIRDVHVVACEDGPFAIAESPYAMSIWPSMKKIHVKDGWVHDVKGIFLVHGKDIKKGSTVNCTIYDIAPTILFMLGLLIPDNISGRVITEMFEEDSETKKRKPQYVPVEYYAEKEKEKIKDSIRTLKMQGNI